MFDLPGDALVPISVGIAERHEIFFHKTVSDQAAPRTLKLILDLTLDESSEKTMSRGVGTVRN